MIACNRCGKENQEHYKFCLGCGAELPRESNRPKRFAAPTPGGGMPKVQRSTSRPPAVSSPDIGAPSISPEDGTPCPNCSATVPPNFRFCHVCGHDLHEGVSAEGVSRAAAPVQPPAPDDARGRLVLIQPDGTEGDAFGLADGATPIGRGTGGLFGNDGYLSPQHAEFRFENNQLVVRDLDSLNGIYIRIEPELPIELFDGSIFRIGQEIIRYEAPQAPEVSPDGTQLAGSPHQGFLGRLCLMIGRNTSGNCFPIGTHGVHLGRERGDVIFPEDGYVSGLHAHVHSEVGHVFLTDLGSSNGTFVRVIGESVVPAGSFVLMGQQLFRADY